MALPSISSAQVPSPSHSDSVTKPSLNSSQTHLQSFHKADASQWRLADLELQVTLGTGSYGRVRLCRRKGTQEFYAIKCLKKAAILKSRQLEHILAEKSILEEVSHPFIVNHIRTFQDERIVYIVLEFVPGGEMFSYLRNAKKFPNEVAKFYFAELLLAFEYLHARNIIYRDLKPENLLLDQHGHVKLTDFGFAKRVPERTFTVCGTPEYLAPELILNKGHGKAVDWWTMGILLYEFIHGFPPFYDESPTRLTEKILEGKFAFASGTSSRARDLIRHLLVVDHTKRIGTRVGGVSEIKVHDYFAGAKWEKLEARYFPAPIQVSVRAPNDTSNFDKYPESSGGTDRLPPLTAAQQQQFATF